MKAVQILLLLLTLSLTLVHAADTPKTAAPARSPQAPASEDLGYDIFEGKTNKIHHVAIANPRFVWVIYEDGTSGRKIPRAELPPQLRARYPYDAKAAADYIENSAKEAEALRASQKQALRNRALELQRQRDSLQAEWGELQKRIANLNRQIDAAPKRSRPKRTEKTRLIEQQSSLRKRIDETETALKRVHQQIDTFQ